MARTHGKDSRVLLNELSVSGQINGWTFEHRRAYSNVACLGDEGERWLPGLLAGAVSLKGFLDTSDGLHSEATAAAGVDDAIITTVLPAGLSVGSPALLAMSDLAAYMTDATVTEAVPAAIVGQPQDGVDMGFCLHGLTAETADGDGTALDNAAGTTGGLVASLHLTAYSGLTNIIVKVQHSTDNSSWSDLVTFATATTVTSERKKVTGTVNRYIRANWDVTGTGSATFAVAAARR